MPKAAAAPGLNPPPWFQWPPPKLRPAKPWAIERPVKCGEKPWWKPPPICPPTWEPPPRCCAKDEVIGAVAIAAASESERSFDFVICQFLSDTHFLSTIFPALPTQERFVSACDP